MDNVTLAVLNHFPSGGYGSTDLYGHRVSIQVNEATRSRGVLPGQHRLLEGTTPINVLMSLPMRNVFVFRTENTIYFGYVNPDPGSGKLSPLGVTREMPVLKQTCHCIFLNEDAYGAHSKKVIGPLKDVEPMEDDDFGQLNVFLVKDMENKSYLIGLIK